MKKLFLVLALAGTLTLTAQDNDALKKQTIEVIKLTGVTEMFDSAIEQIGTLVSEANKEAYTKEAIGTLEGLYENIATIYMEEFTAEDIKGLYDFYNTDLGKKLSEKQGVLTQKGMTAGQTWAVKLQQLAQKYAQ